MGGVKGIEMTTPEQAVTAFLADCGNLIDNMVIRKMTIFGEECVRRVRDRSASESWIDHTGNLRSSIGYSVLRSGKLVTRGGFRTTSAPEGNGSEGVTVGQNYIEQVMRFYHQRYCLVVMAGMNYADKVEAIESKDVLASTELWAKSAWAKYYPQLKNEIKNEVKLLERKYGLA